MYYVGIDYHKKYSHVTAVNQEGCVIRSERLNNTPDEFQEYFDPPGRTKPRGGGGFPDVGSDVRSSGGARRGVTLAQLLRADLIPAAYIPGKATRQFKEMIRQRIYLVRLRTSLKNRIHVFLDRLHVSPPPATDVFGKKGTAYLKKLRLDGVGRGDSAGEPVVVGNA